MGRATSFHVGASPDAFISDSARRYSQARGLSVPAHEDYSNAVMTRPASEAIGRAHDQLPDFDNAAVPAYKKMAQEVGHQFDFLTRPRAKGGMGISVAVTPHDPYGKDSVHDVVGELRDDIRNNNRIQVMSTATTGGHPLFSNDQNDMFRAVHDTFGHLGAGRGVDHHGEEASYLKHSRMFSPLARQALATETRGQNSALRVHGSFQDQKVGILPQHMQQAQFARSGSFEDRLQAVHEARTKNQAQGI